MNFSWAADSFVESKFKKHSERMTRELEENINNNQSPLHSYQIEAVLKTKAMILGDEGIRFQQLLHTGQESKPQPVLIVAPTASGKSGMIVLLPYILSSKKVLILTPSKVISNQLGIAFGLRRDKKCFFEEIGLIGNGERKQKVRESLLEPVKIIQDANDIRESFGNLVIVNAQKFGGHSKLSLVYRNNEVIKDVEAFFREFDTLIVDEAHHYPAKTWSNIMNEFGKPAQGLAKKIIFLTATPFKNIQGNLEFILGPGGSERIAYEISRERLKGVATRKCRFEEPSHEPTPENVYNDVWDFFAKNLQREPRLNPQAMILVRTKVDANALVNELNKICEENGEKNFAVAILAQSPVALEEFTKGNYRVGVTCGVGMEGYDNPNVTVCVILRNIVTGTVLFNQFIGRCMRLKRGLSGGVDKSKGVVLSYPQFAQRHNWDAFEMHVADDDPSDDDEHDDGLSPGFRSWAQQSKSAGRSKEDECNTKYNLGTTETQPKCSQVRNQYQNARTKPASDIKEAVKAYTRLFPGQRQSKRQQNPKFNQGRELTNKLQINLQVTKVDKLIR